MPTNKEQINIGLTGDWVRIINELKSVMGIPYSQIGKMALYKFYEEKKNEIRIKKERLLPVFDWSRLILKGVGNSYLSVSAATCKT